jgi:hypothetical protein
MKKLVEVHFFATNALQRLGKVEIDDVERERKDSKYFYFSFHRKRKRRLLVPKK